MEVPNGGHHAEAEVPKRKLGGVLEVPLLCLGTMTWGQQNTEEEAHAQLDYALSQGLNFIDTAEMYPVPVRPETCTRTEEYIGTWLASRGVRDKVIIATKVTSYIDVLDRSGVVAKRTDPPGLPGPQPNLDRASIRAAVEGSLRRLQTSYIDLYQLHWPIRYSPKFGSTRYQVEKERKGDIPSFEEQVSALGELIKEGKIRHWGLSNETTFGVCQFAETAKRLEVPPPITIQNDFSLTCRHFETELAEACAPSNYNIGLLAYGCLAGGGLTDKYLPISGAAPPSSRHVQFPDFQPRYHCKAVLDAAVKYSKIAKEEGLTLAQLAYAWAASRWYMGSVIIGATTLDQLKENIAAFKVKLSDKALEAIQAVHQENRNPQDLD